MRVFKEQCVSSLEPVEVIVVDDELELPDNLGELTVFFFSVEEDVGTFQTYREGDSIVCFVKQEEAFEKNQEVGSIPDGLWSAKLLFLIMECQQKKMRLIVR